MKEKNLYFQEETQERVLVEKGIVSFCAGKDGTKLYGVQMYVVPDRFGFNMQYRIIEINLENGTSRILRELNSDNFTLENIDNRFLLYIEESYEKQMSKVYQINLANGKVKCIYRTNKKIVGIIEELTETEINGLPEYIESFDGNYIMTVLVGKNHLTDEPVFDAMIL